MSTFNGFQFSLDIDYWEKEIKRKLEPNERKLLKWVENEFYKNRLLDQLQQKLHDDGFYIPQLSQDDGNCLYDSLYILGLIHNIDIFRNSIASLMMIFKDYKEFLPNINIPLKELFEYQNDIEYVYCSKTNRLFKYTYDIMCMDLATTTTWTRLPTQLILTVISLIFNIKLKIHHDNNHITEISALNDTTEEIHLLLIGESHYMPLLKTNNKENKFVFYRDSLSMFIKWTKNLRNELNEKKLIE